MYGAATRANGGSANVCLHCILYIIYLYLFFHKIILTQLVLFILGVLPRFRRRRSEQTENHTRSALTIITLRATVEL